jgi:fumarate hydratase class II
MPGKVNPVIAEALIMVCAQVIGCDAALTLGGLGGVFELNLMMPLIAHNLLHSIELLSNAARTFTQKCVVGLEADENRCRETVERGLALATALAPHIGYDKAAEIAKEAHRSERTVREVAIEWQVLPAEKLDSVLDPAKMT